jgi:hypothetical protein
MLERGLDPQNSLPDLRDGALHTPSVSDHPQLMVDNTPPAGRSTKDTHMDLEVASIVPLLIVGNATAMHSTAASILGALWKYVNKQMSQCTRPTGCFESSRRSVEHGQCWAMQGNWLEQGPKEALKETCQGQLTAGYDRSIGYEVALGAPKRTIPLTRSTTK